MAFKKRPARAAVPSDPEQLYRTLAGGNTAPSALWIHQGDVLRDWHANYSEATDVAIELPTGAGKTLVGGLIGEWRRRSESDRIVYLCPTRQLAQQTADNLRSYGISSVLLTGPVVDWNAASRAKYSSADAIAVSTYSHVFNSNPALDNAQVLVLDDAHAAQGFVASPWSVEIFREDDAYQDVLAVLANALDPLVQGRLRTDKPDGQFISSVYLASPVGVAAAATQLERVLETAASTNAIGREAKYALRLIMGHVDRCMVYASYRSLLIRPLVPPTGVHQAFDSPQQRIYMSATLGAGGELERCFGRTRIHRIPAPKGWDRQGTGRRLFCFPELTTDLSRTPAAVDTWVADVITEHDRAVVLTPEKRVAKVFCERRVAPGTTVYEASDIEDNLEVFTAAAGGVLLLTNRYDGIDLPDDTCRMVVLQGLPARGDLQERFLYSALGALEVLQERIRARVVQGAGRATRNAGDYAVVLILGSDLTSFCTRQDVQAAMHPEVHAELAFGIHNSLDIDSDEIRHNLRVFQAHDEEWRDVEAEINADRDGLDRVDPPGAAELQRAAPAEVSAWLAAWQGEWGRALDFARQAIDALRGGRAPQRYAALWNYLAASWMVRLEQQTGDVGLREASAAYYRSARAAGRGTSWLSHLAAPAETAIPSTDTEVDATDQAAASAIVAAFSDLTKANVFDPRVMAARSGLLGRNSKDYESGLVLLGKLAGAAPSEGDGGASAAPDARWIFSQALWVCWEAKSDAEPAGELGANDVRQAGGHLRYVAAERNEPIPSSSVSLLMTTQERVHPAAHAVAERHVFRVGPAIVVDVFDRVVRAWRALRARGAAGLTEGDVMSALRTERALPTQWLPDFSADALASSGE